MDGKIVVVTGGFGALGQAVAAAASGRGAVVARVDKAAATGTKLPGGIDVGGVDIATEAGAGQAVTDIAKALGGVDVLLNVAGGFAWETLEGGGSQTWLRLFGMNLATTVAMSRAALPHLLRRPGARIVNVAANAAAQRSGAGMGAYAASKAGVIKLTESLAEELKGRDITVNAVLPSIIDTPANRRDMPDADRSDWIRPESLAAVMLFLCSAEAGVISGAAIPVSRGG